MSVILNRDDRKKVVFGELDELRWIRQRSKSLADSIAVCESRLQGLGFDISAAGTASAPGSDKVAAGVAKLIETRDKLATFELEYRQRFEESKMALISCNWSLALWMHCVESMTWNRVGEYMGYSGDYVKHRALTTGIDEAFYELTRLHGGDAW